MFRTTPHQRPCSILSGCTLLILGILLVLMPAGCAKDPSAPPNQEIDPATPTGGDQRELPIAGGEIPAVIEEGVAVTFTVWGTTPDSTWVLDRMEVVVVSSPGDEPGRIEILAHGRSCPLGPDGRLPGHTTGSDSLHAATAYQGVVTLPPLTAGQYSVVLRGPGNEQEFQLEVRPGNGWVQYRLLDVLTADGSTPGVPGRIGISLKIRRDGEAMVYLGGEGAPVRVQLAPDSLRLIADWFAEAGFLQLNDRYLFDPPTAGPKVEISLREDSLGKRILAEPPLMPPALSLLSQRLNDLAMTLYNTRPAPPEVYGDVAVDPLAGDPGTPRVIRLSLRNGGTAPVTLTFPTTQMYDLILLQMTMPDGTWSGPSGPDSSGCPGGGPVGLRSMMGEEPPAPPDSLPGPMPDMAIWNWAYGKGFPTVLTTLTLAPGEVRTFEETWDGRGNLGQTVGSGIFELVAAIPADVPVFVSPMRVVVNGEPPSGQPLAAVVECEPLEGPPGTPRTLTLLVTNLHDQPVEIGFPTSQRFDFAITGPWMMRDADGTVPGQGGRCGPSRGPGEPTDSLPSPPPPSGLLWQWSADQAFNDQPGVETWAPGETRSYTVVWNGSAAPGTVVAPGVYDLAGYLTGRPWIHARPSSFVVTRP